MVALSWRSKEKRGSPPTTDKVLTLMVCLNDECTCSDSSDLRPYNKKIFKNKDLDVRED